MGLIELVKSQIKMEYKSPSFIFTMEAVSSYTLQYTRNATCTFNTTFYFASAYKHSQHFLLPKQILLLHHTRTICRQVRRLFHFSTTLSSYHLLQGPMKDTVTKHKDQAIPFTNSYISCSYGLQSLGRARACINKKRMYGNENITTHSSAKLITPVGNTNVWMCPAPYSGSSKVQDMFDNFLFSCTSNFVSILTLVYSLG